MRIVGITGGTGSGKTTVSGFLRSIGCVVIDADKLSREVDARAEILDAFGQEAFISHEHCAPYVNRAYLRQLIINDPKAKTKLEEIMIPKVTSLFWSNVQLHKNVGVELMFFDCPLLFETDFDKHMYLTICVRADDEARIQRLMMRDGVTRESALKLMATQMPQDVKEDLSDFTIENSGTKKDLLYKTVDSLRHVFNLFIRDTQ